MDGTDRAIEFSRLVSLDRIGPQGLLLETTASEEECRALARRFDLLELPRLSYSARIARVDTGGLRLQVTFIADVVQSCVVTLEPISGRISEEFCVLYAADAEQKATPEVLVDAEAEEPPEPLPEAGIDIGELTAQHLALALAPYPRAANADAGPWGSDNDPTLDKTARAGPFGVLAKLKSGG